MDLKDFQTLIEVNLHTPLVVCVRKTGVNLQIFTGNPYTSYIF